MRPHSTTAFFTAAVLATQACSTPPPAANAAEPQVLVFSLTTGFRHDSIADGVAAIETLGQEFGWTVRASEDPDVFSAGGLDGVDVVVFLSSTTNPDDPDSEWFVGARRAALQDFVRGGGGVVGVHAAADSHYHWPWYGQLIGGYFASHPPISEARLAAADADHPATRALPAQFTRTDEWYSFKDFNPRVRLLATLDPGSIGAADVNPNPMAWSHEFEGGRVFYTAMGHTAESYTEALFLAHLAGGVRWALGED